MKSRRIRIIATAIVLALAGSVSSMTAMVWVSWYVAVRDELNNLDRLARQGLHRATVELADVRTTLSAMGAVTTEAPCSPPHIARMQALTVATPTIAQIDYFENGHLLCNSWGAAPEKLPRSAISATEGGMDLTFDVHPDANPSETMLALRLGNYDVLVKPARLIDTIVENDVSLALLTESGQMVGSDNNPDYRFAASVLHGRAQGRKDGQLFAIARAGGLASVAMEPEEDMRTQLRREQMLYLPIGVFIAGFIVAVVVWLSRRRLSPASELEIGVQQREFVVHYQPIVRLKDGSCIGAEALVRWQRPDGTLVRPDLFIPLAEETGLILPITDQVIGGVLRDLGAALRADPSLHISINLSAADIASGRVLGVLGNGLAENGVAPSQIWLEATERGFVRVEEARATLQRARDAGHHVAMDDFGTGYSSLQYLHSLPLDVLKIDKSFVDTIGLESATSSVTDHIIGMAQALGLACVAEGIENETQRNYLLDHGVEFGQGWLFARPMPAAAFVKWLHEHKPAGTPSA